MCHPFSRVALLDDARCMPGEHLFQFLTRLSVRPCMDFLRNGRIRGPCSDRRPVTVEVAGTGRQFGLCSYDMLEVIKRTWYRQLLDTLNRACILALDRSVYRDDRCSVSTAAQRSCALLLVTSRQQTSRPRRRQDREFKPWRAVCACVAGQPWYSGNYRAISFLGAAASRSTMSVV